jgi:hypothetical protein
MAHRFVLAAILAWFLAQGLALAFHLAPGLAPDEMFHLQFIKIFEQSNFSLLFNNPETLNQGQYSRFGIMLRAPYLYHYTLGAMLNLLQLEAFNFSTIIFLRIINLAMALATLYLFLELCKEFQLTNRETVVALLTFSSSAMFSVLSASVNYDNFINLISILSLLVTIRLMQSPDLGRLLFLILLLCLGVVIKISFAPLAVLIFLFLLLYLAINKNRIQKPKLSFLKICFISASLIIVIALNLHHYLTNIYQYGSVWPSCQNLFNDHQTCLGYHYYALDHHLASAAEGKPRMSWFSYGPFWMLSMLGTVIGIKAMFTYWPQTFQIVGSLNIIFFSALGFWKRAPLVDRRIWPLVAIFFLYISFLLVYVNYPKYLFTNTLVQGLNGRYSFPVLSILAVAIAIGLGRFSFFSEGKLYYAVILFLLVNGLPSALYFGIYDLVLSGPKAEFYSNLPYAPNPIFDKDFNVILPQNYDYK